MPYREQVALIVEFESQKDAVSRGRGQAPIAGVLVSH